MCRQPTGLNIKRGQRVAPRRLSRFDFGSTKFLDRCIHHQLWCGFPNILRKISGASVVCAELLSPRNCRNGTRVAHGLICSVDVVTIYMEEPVNEVRSFWRSAARVVTAADAEPETNPFICLLAGSIVGRSICHVGIRPEHSGIPGGAFCDRRQRAKHDAHAQSAENRLRTALLGA